MRGHLGPITGLRGRCGRCNLEWGLRQDGTLRYHRSGHSLDYWWCAGSQQPPAVVTFIPCVRPGCGHEAISEHSADVDGEPCMVDGCGCLGMTYDSEGFLLSLARGRP